LNPGHLDPKSSTIHRPLRPHSNKDYMHKLVKLNFKCNRNYIYPTSKVSLFQLTAYCSSIYLNTFMLLHRTYEMQTTAIDDPGICLSCRSALKNSWMDRHPICSEDYWGTRNNVSDGGSHPPRQGGGSSMLPLPNYFGLLMLFNMVRLIAYCLIMLVCRQKWQLNVISAENTYNSLIEKATLPQ